MNLHYTPVNLDNHDEFVTCETMRRDIYILGEGSDRRMDERWLDMTLYKDWLREKQNAIFSDFVSFARDENNDIIAHFVLYRERTNHKAAFLDWLYVNKPYRGKKLGAVVLKHIEELALQNGFEKLVFTSVIARENVTKFYKDLSFNCLGVDPERSILWRWEKNIA